MHFTALVALVVVASSVLGSSVPAAPAPTLYVSLEQHEQAR
jgi:hypothetical protein